MNDRMKFGFIGLGMMGKPMSKTVLEAGYPLNVYDVRPEPVEEWVKAGARLLRFLLVWIFAMVPGVGILYAQDYPTKPIRIVTSGLGGGNDIVARILAQGFSSSMGQQVIVENRGSGVAPGQAVSQAPPDGYTLLVAGGSFSLAPLLQKTPYDVVKDFLPISLVSMQLNVLVVHPSLPVKSVKDLIALAKAKPGELSYASTGTGASSHLTGELFKQMAGVNLTRINYKANGPAMYDLMSGEVQMYFPVISSVIEQIKAGRLKGLAVTGQKPSVMMPGVPTMAASGLPEFESVVVTGFYAPAKTPATIINRLNQETVRFLNVAGVKEKFLNIGVEPVGSSPEELAAKIKSEMVRMGKVIKDASIRVD